MMYNKLLFPVALLALSSFQASASCTAEQKHPSGKPDNFNINEHLSKFHKAGLATKFLPQPRSLGTRAAIMAINFAPEAKYDLKANPQYMSSPEFGNWFYGAAAAQMGFNEQEALTAGAVVQQWQNYNKTNHPDAGNVGVLASNIVHAILTGEGDNSDDIAPIKGGHSYSNGPYEQNPDSESGDSCDSDSSSTIDSGGGSSTSYGGGWGGTVFLGAGSCFGACSIPTGSVTITDLPTDDE